MGVLDIQRHLISTGAARSFVDDPMESSKVIGAREMKEEIRVPNLVVLGSQKSGTTTLHTLLAAHPDIFMSSPVKEAHYFYPEEMLAAYAANKGYAVANRRDEYAMRNMLNGYNGERYFGESCPNYTFANSAQKRRIPQNMAALAPDLRFIFIMRNPIERIVSTYFHWRRHSKSDATFQEFMAERGSLAVETSLYWKQLSNYFAVFPKERFHLVAFDEFVSDQNLECRKIFSFLNLPEIEIQAEHRNKNPLKKKVTEVPVFEPDTLDNIRSRIVRDLYELKRNTGFTVPAWDLSGQVLK